MKVDDKNGQKKIVKKVLVIIILLGCVPTILFVFRGCHTKSKVQIDTSHLELNKYNILVEDWNRAVVNAKLNKSFYLPDSNPEAVISRLNDLVSPFYECHRSELQKELSTISKGKKYSFFVFYAAFLETHCIASRVTFDPNQSSNNIRKLIGEITKQDRIDTNTVAIIASMNEPCVYFDTFRDDLYEKGMTRNIRSCKELRINQSKYPLLFHLVFNKT